MYYEANITRERKLYIYTLLWIKCYPNPPLNLGYIFEHTDTENSFFQCSAT